MVSTCSLLPSLLEATPSDAVSVVDPSVYALVPEDYWGILDYGVANAGSVMMLAFFVYFAVLNIIACIKLCE